MHAFRRSPRLDTIGERTTGVVSRYEKVRQATVRLCDRLTPEDCAVQSMPDASPAKWHLAHTTWFFETFVIARATRGHASFRDEYGFLFNSYYNAVGDRHPRPRRGLITRPGLSEILAYRDHVDGAMRRILETGDPDRAIADAVEIGLNHEQQHQELILMDIKHLFSCNPLRPAYAAARADGPAARREPVPVGWIAFDEAVRPIGHGGDGFAFDNERPRHRVLVPAFAIASRTVTNGEYLRFIEAGGYARPDHWLSDGWDTVRAQGWVAPLYWENNSDRWMEFTLSGLSDLDLAAPVCHVSYYEADAYARWSGARLPTEAEWETAATEGAPAMGSFLEDGVFHPQASAGLREPGAPAPSRMLGDVWEWTSSPYVAYPGYRPPEGALGEYNGKFMCNQMVLRGGACVTPRSHIRATYRNFFYPACRWQFGGIRLARDAG